MRKHSLNKPESKKKTSKLKVDPLEKNKRKNERKNETRKEFKMKKVIKE